MSWIAAAIVGSAAIGYLGSQSAASTQAGAQEQAAATQQGMFNTITGNSQPFMQAGYKATDSLSQLMGLAGSPGAQVAGTGLNQGYLAQPFNPTQQQLQQYPGFQFALQTGGQATRNADTPGMGALSGAALKDLTNFNVGTATQYYGQYFNQDQTQKTNIYQRLSQIAGLGQSAAAQVGKSGTQLGGGIAGAQAAAGGSLASGILGGTSSLVNGSNGLASLLYANQTPQAPYVTPGSDPNGYNGTQNNLSAYVGGS